MICHHNSNVYIMLPYAFSSYDADIIMYINYMCPSPIFLSAPRFLIRRIIKYLKNQNNDASHKLLEQKVMYTLTASIIAHRLMTDMTKKTTQ